MHQDMTIKEAAEALGLAESSIRRMVAEEHLPSRQATQAELGALLADVRIAGVPGRGVRLIPRQAVLEAMARPKQRGRPKKDA